MFKITMKYFYFRTFDFNNRLSNNEQSKGPIRNATILRINTKGTVVKELGKDQ